MSEGNDFRLEELERRIQVLEKFRDEYTKELQNRLIFETKISSSVQDIDKKLDKLLEWQESQVAKPGKRWDSIVEKIVLTVIGAFVGAMLMRLGLG